MQEIGVQACQEQPGISRNNQKWDILGVFGDSWLFVEDQFLEVSGGYWGVGRNQYLGPQILGVPGISEATKN